MRVTAAVLVEPRRFEMREFPYPIVGRDDGVVKMEAVGICGTDYTQYKGQLNRWNAPYPIIPGHENVGIVDALGDEAADRWGVKKGDRVFIDARVPCGHCKWCLSGHYRYCKDDLGYGLHISCERPPYLWGGYGQYMYLHPNIILHPLPENVSSEEATLIIALANGVRWVQRAGQVRPGETVLIQGVGQQGLGCLIAAKECGARVIVSGRGSVDQQRFSVARSMGADETIDVEKDDLIDSVLQLTDGEGAELVVEVSGAAAAQQALSEVTRVLGRVVLAGISGGKESPMNLDRFVQKEIQIQGVFTSDYSSTKEAIRILAEGRFPFHRLVTHSFPLEDAEHAVRMVGREITGEDSIHVVLRPYDLV